MRVKRFHNICDMNNCNDKIGDLKIVKRFIKEVISAIDMKVIKGPISVRGIDINPGLSVIAIVDFSHISIHTFTNFNEILVDIFSCKKYEKEKVVEICKKYFGSKKSKVRQKEVWWG